MTASGSPIHVVFTVDEHYAMPLAATICSLSANASRDRALHIHIVHEGFAEPLRDKIALSLRAGGHPDSILEWHQLDLGSADHLRKDDVSQTVYMRLFIPQCLPDHVEKAIFLDADLIVLGDIADLWDQSLDGKMVLAARDRIGLVSAPSGVWNFEALGIASDAPYFNAGVLVLNLDKWRQNNVTSQVLCRLTDDAGQLKLADQGALNAVLFDDWKELDFKWNWQVVPDLEAAQRAGCWGLDRTEKSIVHFVTSAKPWVPGSRYAEKALFFQYLDRTPWQGWRVPPNRECWTSLKRSLRCVVNMLHVPALSNRSGQAHRGTC